MSGISSIVETATVVLGEFLCSVDVFGLADDVVPGLERNRPGCIGGVAADSVEDRSTWDAASGVCKRDDCAPVVKI